MGLKTTEKGIAISWGMFWKALTDRFGALDNIEVELPNEDMLIAYIDGTVKIEKRVE